MTDPSLEPTTIIRHANAVFGPMAMLAGMELDLFSVLGDGPRSAPEIRHRARDEPIPHLTLTLSAPEGGEGIRRIYALSVLIGLPSRNHPES